MTTPDIPDTPGARAARRLPKKAQNRFWRIVNLQLESTWEQIFRGTATEAHHEFIRRVEAGVIYLRRNGAWYEVYDSAAGRALGWWRAP